MKPEEAKAGLYIRWKSDRVFKQNWEVYGKITAIKGNEVSIQTFDDFKVTVISLHGEALADEVTLATREVAIAGLEQRMSDLEIEIRKEEASTKQNLRKLKDLYTEIQVVVEDHELILL